MTWNRYCTWIPYTEESPEFANVIRQYLDYIKELPGVQAVGSLTQQVCIFPNSKTWTNIEQSMVSIKRSKIRKLSGNITAIEYRRRNVVICQRRHYRICNYYKRFASSLCKRNIQGHFYQRGRYLPMSAQEISTKLLGIFPQVQNGLKKMI